MFDAKNILVSTGVTLNGVFMSVTTKGSISVQSGATVKNSTLITQTTGTIVDVGTIEGCHIVATRSTISSGGSSLNNVYAVYPTEIIYNFTSDVNNTASSSIITSQIVTVTSGSSFDINSNYWDKNVTVTLNTGSYNCFLAGAMIETINGLIAIEDIQVGDQIITYNNQQQQKSVIWTGYNQAYITAHVSDNLSGYPVRIIKNAIAEGVPSKGLLLTSEHCVLLNDHFIPVRMLVNDTSIFYDYNITEYTFYHIETEEHSIISADNLLTESYFNTGNRSSFISYNNTIDITNKNKKWNIDSAAPLTTTREIVEPIFTQISQRCITLDFTIVDKNILTTDDSGLHLVTNSGQLLDVTYQKNGNFIFKIPENTTQILLISRTQCPNESIGSFVDDRRRLGVLIGEVTLLEGNKTSPVTEHLTANNLQGWHDQEQTKCRWTNGHALLTIKNTPSENIGMLIIQVLAAGPYVIEDMNIQQEAV